MSKAVLKILHLHFGTNGGAERFFVNLASSFGELGVRQRFVIRPNRVWRPEIEHLGPIIENHYRRLSISAVWLKWRVMRMSNEWRPNAIMAWMPRAARLIPAYPGAVRLVRLGDFPQHLKHFERCDLLIGNIPGIGLHCRDLGWNRPIVTITNFPRDVVPSPVAKSNLNTPEDAFVICGAGRFVKRKGLDLLIRIAAHTPNSYLWLIGDGPERNALERSAKAAGIIDRTRFTGWVDEPIHYISASDIFLMPSRHEPLGNVVLEAWMAGVPVVATRTEGPCWYMENGENGVLTDIDDVEAMCSAVERIRENPVLREHLVAGGRTYLSSFFSKSAITNRYLEIFSGNSSIPKH